MTPSFKKVFELKIILRDIKPPIWRRIQVPNSYSFWDLHVAIQDAMGWQDYHVHEFQAYNPASKKVDSIGIADEGSGISNTLSGLQCKLSDYLTLKTPKIFYTYDFGDDWLHEIKLEKILPRAKDTAYPLCLTGKRACPPEDCGGAPGYADLLTILAKPKHKEHKETLKWLGDAFDPEHFSKEEIIFDDPAERLNDLLQNNQEMDRKIGDEKEETPDIYGPLKQMNREALHAIWEKARTGDLEGLDPEDRQLGRIMQEHADEFFNIFEFADVIYDQESAPENDMDPFLHICIHSAVENQLATQDPPEARQFYEAMRQKKFPHHDTLHLIGAILMPFLFDCVLQKQPFEREAYSKLLKKYKTKAPEKILDLLEMEE